MAKKRGLTIFYIIEPGKYEQMGCYLLASIRLHFKGDVDTIAYCPTSKMHALQPSTFIAHEMMGGQICSIHVPDVFNPPYPHGNKIIAALQPRDSAYSMFMDSDIIFINDARIENYVLPGHVSASLATSQMWGSQGDWPRIYEACGLPVTTARYDLQRSGKGFFPYFNAGMIAFPEGNIKDDKSFAEIWFDTACMIDAIEDLERKRPYLDQMSLPLAIQSAGLRWNILSEEQQYIYGGQVKGKPLPEDKTIMALHYRQVGHLGKLGLMEQYRRNLSKLTGVRFLGRLNPQPQEVKEAEDSVSDMDMD